MNKHLTIAVLMIGLSGCAANQYSGSGARFMQYSDLSTLNVIAETTEPNARICAQMARDLMRRGRVSSISCSSTSLAKSLPYKGVSKNNDRADSEWDFLTLMTCIDFIGGTDIKRGIKCYKKS